MKAEVVAVTGATGFLGGRIVEQLARQGRRVRILARQSSVVRPWPGFEPEVVRGDLRDSEAIARLVEQSDTVVHVAGLIKARRRGDFFTINEAATAQVALAAVGRRLVHVSSLAAREPSLSDYAASKHAGEKAVREIAGAAAIIIRPPAIYGPGDRETLPLFRAASSPVLFMPGPSGLRLAVAEVDDVAKIVAEMVDEPGAGSTVTIGGDRPNGYSWSELAAAAALSVGRSPTVVIGIPGWMLLAGGLTAGVLGRLQGTAPIFTSGKAREALHSDWSVSASEAGITAARQYTPLNVGFAKTVAWYRAHGWLP